MYQSNAKRFVGNAGKLGEPYLLGFAVDALGSLERVDVALSCHRIVPGILFYRYSARFLDWLERVNARYMGFVKQIN